MGNRRPESDRTTWSYLVAVLLLACLMVLCFAMAPIASCTFCDRGRPHASWSKGADADPRCYVCDGKGMLTPHQKWQMERSSSTIAEY